jgi:hypothetical protein
MVLALALHLDPVYVGAHHLATRFLVVTFAIAVPARRIAISDGLRKVPDRDVPQPNDELTPPRARVP